MAFDYMTPYWNHQAWGQQDCYCLHCQRPRYYSYTERCWSCDTPLISLETADKLSPEQKRSIESELRRMADTNVLVDRDAASYLNECVMACPGEVGGLGYVKLLPNGDLWVYEFCLLEQEATASGVEFDEKAMALFLEAEAKRDDFSNLRVSWHSHGNMGTFWSGTDTGDAIEKYKAMGTPWLLSLLFNRKGEVATRLDVFDSEAIDHLWLEDLAYRVVAPNGIGERAKADVKRLVHKPKVHTYSSSNKGPQKKGTALEESKGANITVIEGGRRKVYQDGKQIIDEPLSKPLTRKERKQQRKQKEKQLLAAEPEMTEREIKTLNNEELDELIEYAEALNRPRPGQPTYEGKPIHSLTDQEWQAYIDENGGTLIG